MRAFHIVRVDLELGLAVGAGLGREQEVVVGLLRVGPLGAGPHDDAPSEDAACPLGQHAVEEFVARTVWLRMVDHGVMIRVLRAAQEVQAVENQLGAGTVQHGADIVPGQGCPHRDHVKCQIAVAFLS